MHGVFGLWLLLSRPPALCVVSVRDCATIGLTADKDEPELWKRCGGRRA